MMTVIVCLFIGFLLGIVGISLLSMNRMNDAEDANKARIYLIGLLRTISPQTMPSDDLITLCTQIDNYIAGIHISRDDLKKAYESR